MRRLLRGAFLAAMFEIFAQHGSEIRMRAIFDDSMRALLGRQAAQVGISIFRHQEMNIVLGMVDVRYKGHDTGKRSVFGR